MSSGVSKLDAEQFASISKALADPSRFEMLQRIARPKEAPTCSSTIAPPVSFLASEDAHWITGETIFVSGGAAI